MRGFYSLLLFLGIFFFSFTSYSQKVCPYTNVDFGKSYQWPTHTNWFNGINQRINFGANGNGAANRTSLVGPAMPYKSYESTATASDEKGNLVLFTNGVNLWDGNLNEIPVPGGRLLTGAELTNGDAGSAVQGVIIVKHPLDTNNYYIFTTDDAILGESGGVTNGFNYYVYSKATNSVTGPTRLGNYRSTEQVAATWHNNGVDIWIVTHESVLNPATSRKYYAYLLTCGGLETSPVTSDAGFQVTRRNVPGGYSNERASLVFEYNDGSNTNVLAAATHHCGQGTWDPVNSVSVLNFNNLAGTFTHVRGLGDGSLVHSNPYAAEFTPNASRLYVTFQSDQWSGPLLGRIGYFPVTGGAYTLVASTTGSIDIGVPKMGGDGRMYAGGFEKSPYGFLNSFTTISNPEGAATGNTNGLAAGAGSVGYGLPNMFVPPRDWLQIVDPGVITDCGPVDLDVNWVCKGTDAENTPLYENSWSVKDAVNTSIDPVTGLFTANGPGKYWVYNQICTIIDSLEIEVISCNCNVDVKNVNLEICQGERINLDSLFIASSGVGSWVIDSLPTNASPINLSISGGDTLFVSNINTTPGKYKIIFSINNKECYDSLYITVKYQPVASIVPFGPICRDSIVNIVGRPTIANDTTGLWLINLQPKLTNVFNPTLDNHIINGNNTVTYAVAVNGCYDTTSTVVNVLPRATITVTPQGPFCSDQPTVTFVSTPNSGTWFINQNKTIGSSGAFNPSNAGPGTYNIWRTITGQCGASDTVQVVVNPRKDAAITTPNSQLCTEDNPLTLNAAFDGGNWFVTDVTRLDSMIRDSVANKAVFNPAKYAPGVYTVYYLQPNPCGDTQSVVITVVAKQNAAFTTPQTVFCASDPAVTFVPTATSGVWSGAGINATSGVFTPSAGTANSTPYYIYYTLSGNCPHKDSVLVTVHRVPNATINGYPAANDSLIVCVLEADPTFTVAEAGGTWNNAAVIQNGTNIRIDLNILTNNKTTMVNNVRLIYTQPNPCERKDTVWISTTNQLDATINQPNPICDSVDSVQITRPNSTLGTWSANCGNCINATTGRFYPKISGDGTFDITYTIPGSCGDADTKQIVVNRTPNPAITSNNGDTIKQCIDGPLVNLTTAEPNGVWQSIPANLNGFNTTNGTLTPTTTGAGTFRLRYSFAGTCPAADTIVVKIDPMPVIAFNFDTIFCDNHSQEVLNVTPTGGTWSGLGVVGNNFNPAIANKGTNANPTANTITYNVTVGLCSNSKQQIMNVIAQPVATITQVGPYCNTDSVVNLVTTGTGGVWTSNKGGLTNATNGVFNPGGLNLDIYSIYYTINGFCKAADTIDIDVRGPKNPNIIPQNSICLGEANEITFNAATVGTWSGDVNSAGTLFVVDSGRYTIINTINEICRVADTIEFEVKFVPDVNFEADIINGCVGFTETFRDITVSASAGNAVSSVWTFGNGSQRNALGTTTTTYNTSGSFTVSLTNTYANGCSNSETKQNYITANPYPNADFTWSPNTLSVLDGAVRFTNNSSGAVNHLWTFERNIINPRMDFEPVVYISSDKGDTVDVKLLVTSANGCRDSIVKPIIIQDFATVYIPNAFTPDGDDLNDTFFPTGRNITSDDYHFMIFNRWGTLIWESFEPYKGWDGTVLGGSGVLQQIDVYVWKLVYRDQFKNERHEKVGTVTLYR